MATASRPSAIVSRRWCCSSGELMVIYLHAPREEQGGLPLPIVLQLLDALDQQRLHLDHSPEGFLHERLTHHQILRSDAVLVVVEPNRQVGETPLQWFVTTGAGEVLQLFEQHCRARSHYLFFDAELALGLYGSLWMPHTVITLVACMPVSDPPGPGPLPFVSLGAPPPRVEPPFTLRFTELYDIPAFFMRLSPIFLSLYRRSHG